MVLKMSEKGTARPDENEGSSEAVVLESVPIVDKEQDSEAPAEDEATNESEKSTLSE